MKRQEIERRIASKVIEDALAAGYAIDVYDGDDYPLQKSADAEAIIGAMFSTDDDRLFFRKEGKIVGWVWFIYGENGWDVINDYTTNLEDVLKGASELSQQLEQKVHG